MNHLINTTLKMIGGLSMKLNYVVFLLALVAIIFVSPAKETKAQSGDTLTVEWLDTGGNFIKNALYLAIQADTLRPEGRVYKLRKGGYYWTTEIINNNGWTLRIVGEEPDPNDPAGNPAVLQIVARDDGTYPGKLINGNGSMVLKNLYIIGSDDIGVQGSYYQQVQIDASNSRYIIDNCIFDRSNFSILAWTAKNNDIFVTNCVFRNMVESPPTQIWAGRGMSIWADQDTVVVENNTFFNIDFTAFQLEAGIANYLRFNHNTIVNNSRGINTTPWLFEAYFTNNLIINGFFDGEAFNQNELLSSNRDPRATTSGVFGFGALPSKYGPEDGRRIVFGYNAAWLDPAFISWHADSIRTQPFIGPVTKIDFVDPYDQIVVTDTTWLSNRPDFPTYPSELIPNMIANVNGVRAGASSIPTWFWNIPIDPGTGTECFTCPSWPLPEDFSYTTPSLLTAGTSNMPLGDLNWLPNKKAEWEAIKDQDITLIESLAGAEVTYPLVSVNEAEDANLSGTCTIKTFEGFTYVQMDGGGYFEWIFDNPTAQQYDLNVWTHMRGNNMRGQHHIINGVEIHDVAHGWGELIYDNASGVTTGMPINEWTWVRWTQADLIEAGALTIPAGQCTLRVSVSWGYQNFAGMYLEPAGTGTPLISLRIPDLSSFDLVTLQAEGADYVPSGFKTVELGANGTIEWNLTAPTAGDYGLVIFYQAPNGSQDITMNAGGQNIPVTLTGEVDDSTGSSKLTTVVPLSAGATTVSLTGGNVLIDYIQFVQKVISSIDERPEIPNGYNLSQNYPNPFNPSTKINFDLGKPSNVKLYIYDILGRRVATLVDQYMNTGAYTVNFDASRLASGVYFYSIEAGDFKMNKKMILLK